MSPRLLVVDDDRDLLDVLRLMLGHAGYQVLTAASGEEALEVYARERPDLVVLDVMMPGMDGWDTMARLRELAPVPVIMLTALGQVDDRIHGLVAGADDYVPKPFHREVFLGRTAAVLRRARAQPPPSPNLLRVGWLRIELDHNRIQVHDTPHTLAGKEWQILCILAESEGRVVPYDTFAARIWPENTARCRDRLKVAINRLRFKVGDHTSPYQLIHTVRSVGYSLAYRPRPPAERLIPTRRSH